MNDFQTNRAILRLVEEREEYHEAIRLFHRIFNCLKEKPNLSQDELDWVQSMQVYIDRHSAEKQ